MNAIPGPLFEVINALLSSLGLCVLVIFGRYMWFEYRSHGWDRVRLRAAISISVVTTGEVLTRGWVFSARWLQDTGHDVHWMFGYAGSSIPALGMTISAIGMLCMIRVFTPDEWGTRAWITCAILAGGVTVLTQIIR